MKEWGGAMSRGDGVRTEWLDVHPPNTTGSKSCFMALKNFSVT
jgi:hypothetical protein